MKRFIVAPVLFLFLLMFVGSGASPVAAGHGHYRVHVGYHHHYHSHYRPFYSPYSWGFVAPVAYRAYRPVASAVETDVRPKRAQVSLDGQPMGQARDFNGPWDLLVVPPGTHLLTFEAPGYQTLEIEIDAVRGGYYHIRESLVEGDGRDPRSSENVPVASPPPDPAAGKLTTGRLVAGRLHLQVQPLDAAVYLDGEFLAKAGELARLHGALAVAAGEHTLEVTRPGYVDATRVVIVERDQPTRLRIALEKP